MDNIILFYIIWISISFTYHYAIAQDYKNLWNQCQRYNTIALETYKKCYGKLDLLTEKHEEIQANHNQTKLELISCQELASKFTMSLQRSNTIALEAYKVFNISKNIHLFPTHIKYITYFSFISYNYLECLDYFHKTSYINLVEFLCIIFLKRNVK